MAWALVQNAILSNASTTTFSATFTNPVGVGNMVVGCLGHDSGQTISSVKDDKNNTYTTYQSLTDTTDGVKHDAFFFMNATNGPKTVNVVVSPSNVGCMQICEFSGGGTASDGTAAGQFQNNIAGGTDNATSTNMTTTVDGDLIIGTCVVGDSATLATIGTGFTTCGAGGVHAAAVISVQLEFFVQTTHGAKAATFTVAANRDPMTAVNAFLVAAGADVLQSQAIM